MKKSKFLLLGSVASLAAIPFVAAKCGDTKDENKKPAETPGKDQKDPKAPADDKMTGDKDKAGKDKNDKKDNGASTDKKDPNTSEGSKPNNNAPAAKSNLKAELKSLWDEVSELARARSKNEFESLFYEDKQKLESKVNKLLSEKEMVKQKYDEVVKEIESFKNKIKTFDGSKTVYELSKLQEQRDYFASLMPILKSHRNAIDELVINNKTNEEPELLSDLETKFDELDYELTDVIKQYDLAIEHFHQFKKDSPTYFKENLFKHFDELMHHFEKFLNKDNFINLTDEFEHEEWL
ncbi:variable surface lipoprotein [Mycoplasmopsis agalactiae]|uniref:variable surface lipoprotein n=1 Tax=Mycoplasmopsis agalactiae TaxID=2110 RepID=UPI00211C8083|nr:variable surface lipoprotein [Mycoplasmopsis agalactiae]UUM25487.1 variable surface lipoprotein [Mycoplasmopsis agalactiae]